MFNDRVTELAIDAVLNTYNFAFIATGVLVTAYAVVVVLTPRAH